MANGRLIKKVRKKLGIAGSNQTRLQKSSSAKIHVQPSGKGCCGKSK